jgi:gluconate 5-dehydrogenase
LRLKRPAFLIGIDRSPRLSGFAPDAPVVDSTSFVMDPLFDLSGRRALVTGSSRGLGRVLARALAQRGARVILHGRDAAALAETAAAFRGEELSCETAIFDVADPTASAEAVRALIAAGGTIDILVNNAGIQRRGPLLDLSLADWQAVLDTNLTAAFALSQAVAPAMIAAKRGKIINICSLMSELGRPTTGNYMAAKGGLKMLTRAMTVEWARHNIQANAIGPGYFATEMTRPLVENPGFNQWICGRTPAGRWGNPEELTGALLLLASPASDFINGQILFVDGGLTAAI